MVIKKVKYYKDIIKNYKRTPKLFKSYPAKLKAEILNKFALFRAKILGEEEGYLGYDGQILYVFNIQGFGIPQDNEYPSRKYRYLTKIEIKKSGSRKDVKNLSDLEQFLINDGFKLSN